MHTISCFCWSVLLSFSLAGTAVAQWVQTNGTFAEEVRCFAVSGTNLFAGVNRAGAYRSTDSGATWTAVNTSLTGSGVTCFAVSGNYLFAGTSVAGSGGGVFRSSDSGTTWTRVVVGFGGYGDINALAVSSTDLYAGSLSGTVLRSTNIGATWTPVHTFGNGINALAVSGANLLAGTGGGIFRSTDNGTSWVAVGSGFTGTPMCFVVIGTNVFAEAFIGGPLLSTDGGSSWTAVNSGSTMVGARTLAASGTSLFAGSYGGGVLCSTDNGANWTAVNSGLASQNIYALAVSGSNLFAGAYASVWRRPLSEMIVSVAEPGVDVPADFLLDQNYPNPFNPSTTISYALPRRSNVTLTVFNTLGEQVATLVDGEVAAGYHEVHLDATGLASGVYFYRLQAGGYTETKKLCLVR